MERKVQNNLPVVQIEGSSAPAEQDWELTATNQDGKVLRHETDKNPKRLFRLGRTTHGATHVEVTPKVLGPSDEDISGDLY